MLKERIDFMDNKELEKIAKRLRFNIVKMVGPDTPGHFGGSFSMAEIVTVLYFHKMRLDKNDPKWPGRDRLVFSKGHSGIIQYAALAELGYFPKEELWNLKKLVQCCKDILIWTKHRVLKPIQVLLDRVYPLRVV